VLNINKVATEQYLEDNNYLEEVGQTIYQVAVVSSFVLIVVESLMIQVIA
jgi:hypothetical protein